MHRDLKPENILLEQDEDFSKCKLIDFGISAKLGANNLTSSIGTPFYMAPEVLGKNYDERCDVWSLGVIAYACLTGSLPF